MAKGIKPFLEPPPLAWHSVFTSVNLRVGHACKVVITTHTKPRYMQAYILFVTFQAVCLGLPMFVYLKTTVCISNIFAQPSQPLLFDYTQHTDASP